MELWKALLLGIVQGLTEFLPVSSSGHVILAGKLIGADGGLFFGVMLHAGTLIAVCFAYFSKITEMIRRDRKRIGYLLLATLPAAAVGWFFGDAIDAVFFGGEWLWLFFALTALLLLLAQCRMRRGRVLRPIDAKISLIAGGAQALAVIPGLSRSGTTLSACILAGADREEAADFSFLMSIPIIAGAIVAELFKVFSGSPFMAEISWLSLAVGSVAAAVCGFLSIRFVQKFVKRGSLTCFAVYLILLSATVLVAAACGVL